MNEMICKGAVCDYDDIIDFGNLVFRLDFKSLLPKLYDNHPEKAQCHHLAKEKGKIKAMVGKFPPFPPGGGKTFKGLWDRNGVRSSVQPRKGIYEDINEKRRRGSKTKRRGFYGAHRAAATYMNTLGLPAAASSCDLTTIRAISGI